MNSRPGDSTTGSHDLLMTTGAKSFTVSPPTRDIGQGYITLYWYDPSETRHFRLDPFTGLYIVSSIPAIHQLVASRLEEMLGSRSNGLDSSFHLDSSWWHAIWSFRGWAINHRILHLDCISNKNLGLMQVHVRSVNIIPDEIETRNQTFSLQVAFSNYIREIIYFPLYLQSLYYF